MLPQKILKIRCLEMRFQAISGIYLLRIKFSKMTDQFNFCYILYSQASNIDGSIHLLFMILLAISCYS